MNQHAPDQVFGFPGQALVDVAFLEQLQGVLEEAVRLNAEWQSRESPQLDALGKLGAIINAAKGKGRIADFFLEDEEVVPAPAPERLQHLAKIIVALRDDGNIQHVAYHLGTTPAVIRATLSREGFAYFNGTEVLIDANFVPLGGTKEQRDADLAILDRLIDELEGVQR